MVLIAAALPAQAMEKCESFGDLRLQIDALVKVGAPQAETFRSEVHSGADSLYMLEQISPPDMLDKLDRCRFEVVEYLTKLGFPPAH